MTPGLPQERLLITGIHTVSDICCGGCRRVLGWKYVRQLSSDGCLVRLTVVSLRQDDALEPSQKYKIGKFIVEKAQLMAEINR